ncbi:MAG: hypothetical protein LLG00_12030, partial [Planctomycetaceae bacterium]|nr:hypothetical protein [Planctomycetaceae bacterium]
MEFRWVARPGRAWPIGELPHGTRHALSGRATRVAEKESVPSRLPFPSLPLAACCRCATIAATHG